MTITWCRYHDGRWELPNSNPSKGGQPFLLRKWGLSKARPHQNKVLFLRGTKTHRGQRWDRLECDKCVRLSRVARTAFRSHSNSSTPTPPGSGGRCIDRAGAIAGSKLAAFVREYETVSDGATHECLFLRRLAPCG